MAYRRVSTLEQAGERHSSLPEQEARIGVYCAADNLALVASFTDIVTGKRDNRPEYLRMVKYVLDGGADVVVVQWLDRFGRNAREILRRIWELQEAGVSVVASDEDIREELMLLIKAGFAGQESRRNGERVRSKMTTAARKGTHFGRPPFGFRRVVSPTGDISFEQDEAEALAVREMVRLAVEENLGYKSIGDRLTAGGFPARYGHGWSADTVRKILANDALVGTLTYNKRPAKANTDAELVMLTGFFPAILEPEQWAALHERLRIRRENPRGATHASEYLLSGIARCGHCGGPMVGKKGNLRKGRQYRNYWCSYAQRSRAKCALYNGHSAPKLERAILEHLSQYDDADRVRALLAVAPASEGASPESLERVERRLAELDRDFLSNLDLLKRGVLDEQDFSRANAARKGEREGLEQRRSEVADQVKAATSRAAAVATLPDRVRSFLDDVESLETRKAKAHLQTILAAAHVYRDGRIELEFRTGR